MSVYIPNVYSPQNVILNDFSLYDHHDKDSNNITIMIVIDALSDQFFRENINRAPNIRTIINQGGYYLKNTTCIPSCTGIGHTFLFSGVGPNKHQVSGLNFFDKETFTHYNCLSNNIERLMNTSLSQEVKTVFENNPGVKSASIWNPVSRGADISIPYYSSWYHHATRLALQQIDRGARILTIWYPLLDPIGHYLGKDHEFRKFWFHRIDYQIGLLCNELQLRNLLEKSMLYITADHGQVETSKRFDLYRFFKELGLKVYGGVWDTVDEIKDMSDFDVFICRNGYRFAHIYYSDRVSSELREKIKELLIHHEGVRNAFLAKNSHVFVHSENGKSVITGNNEMDEKYSYKILLGQDPLAYDKQISVTNGSYYNESEWKKNTIFSESPNVVPQIYQLMNSKRAGDLSLVASDDYQFSPLLHKASHGGFTPEEMIVPAVALFPLYYKSNNLKIKR